MYKLGPWPFERRGHFGVYFLAQELEWKDVQDPTATFREIYPELHTWLMLTLPQNRFHAYRLYLKLTKWNLVLGIHDLCHNQSFQKAWKDCVVEKV